MSSDDEDRGFTPRNNSSDDDEDDAFLNMNNDNNDKNKKMQKTANINNRDHQHVDTSSGSSQSQEDDDDDDSPLRSSALASTRARRPSIPTLDLPSVLRGVVVDSSKSKGHSNNNITRTATTIIHHAPLESNSTFGSVPSINSSHHHDPLQEEENIDNEISGNNSNNNSSHLHRPSRSSIDDALAGLDDDENDDELFAESPFKLPAATDSKSVASATKRDGSSAVPTRSSTANEGSTVTSYPLPRGAATKDFFRDNELSDDQSGFASPNFTTPQASRNVSLIQQQRTSASVRDGASSSRGATLAAADKFFNSLPVASSSGNAATRDRGFSQLSALSGATPREQDDFQHHTQPLVLVATATITTTTTATTTVNAGSSLPSTASASSSSSSGGATTKQPPLPPPHPGTKGPWSVLSALTPSDSFQNTRQSNFAGSSTMISKTVVSQEEKRKPVPLPSELTIAPAFGVGDGGGGGAVGELDEENNNNNNNNHSNNSINHYYYGTGGTATTNTTTVTTATSNDPIVALSAESSQGDFWGKQPPPDPSVNEKPPQDNYGSCGSPKLTPTGNNQLGSCSSGGLRLSASSTSGSAEPRISGVDITLQAPSAQVSGTFNSPLSPVTLYTHANTRKHSQYTRTNRSDQVANATVGQSEEQTDEDNSLVGKSASTSAFQRRPSPRPDEGDLSGENSLRHNPPSTSQGPKDRATATFAGEAASSSTPELKNDSFNTIAPVPSRPRSAQNVTSPLNSNSNNNNNNNNHNNNYSFGQNDKNGESQTSSPKYCPSLANNNDAEFKTSPNLPNPSMDTGEADSDLETPPPSMPESRSSRSRADSGAEAKSHHRDKQQQEAQEQQQQLPMSMSAIALTVHGDVLSSLLEDASGKGNYADSTSSAFKNIARPNHHHHHHHHESDGKINNAQYYDNNNNNNNNYYYYRHPAESYGATDDDGQVDDEDFRTASSHVHAGGGGEVELADQDGDEIDIDQHGMLNPSSSGFAVDDGSGRYSGDDASSLADIHRNETAKYTNASGFLVDDDASERRLESRSSTMAPPPPSRPYTRAGGGGGVGGGGGGAGGASGTTSRNQNGTRADSRLSLHDDDEEYDTSTIKRNVANAYGNVNGADDGCDYDDEEKREVQFGSSRLTENVHQQAASPDHQQEQQHHQHHDLSPSPAPRHRHGHQHPSSVSARIHTTVFNEEVFRSPIPGPPSALAARGLLAYEDHHASPPSGFANSASAASSNRRDRAQTHSVLPTYTGSNSNNNANNNNNRNDNNHNNNNINIGSSDSNNTTNGNSNNYDHGQGASLHPPPTSPLASPGEGQDMNVSMNNNNNNNNNNNQSCGSVFSSPPQGGQFRSDEREAARSTTPLNNNSSLGGKPPLSGHTRSLSRTEHLVLPSLQMYNTNTNTSTMNNPNNSSVTQVPPPAAFLLHGSNPYHRDSYHSNAASSDYGNNTPRRFSDPTSPSEYHNGSQLNSCINHLNSSSSNNNIGTSESNAFEQQLQFQLFQTSSNNNTNNNINHSQHNHNNYNYDSSQVFGAIQHSTSGVMTAQDSTNSHTTLSGSQLGSPPPPPPGPVASASTTHHSHHETGLRPPPLNFLAGQQNIFHSNHNNHNNITNNNNNNNNNISSQQQQQHLSIISNQSNLPSNTSSSSKSFPGSGAGTGGFGGSFASPTSPSSSLAQQQQQQQLQQQHHHLQASAGLGNSSSNSAAAMLAAALGGKSPSLSPRPHSRSFSFQRTGSALQPAASFNGTATATSINSMGSPMMINTPRSMLLQSPRAQTKAAVQISKQIIGSGASGNVWLGIHLATCELVAVKTVQLNVVERSPHTPELSDAGRAKESKKHLEELAAEMRLMRELSHPCIVKFINAERQGTTLNFYMEYMGGGSLASIVEKFGPLQVNIVQHYMRDVLRGIQYLHSKDIIHRDIKPENVLLSASGQAKLSDFGTSRKVEVNRQNKTLTGTPWYMAPEVAKGDAYDMKADIWSFGCTCAMLLTGRPPWSNVDNPTSVMFQIASKPDEAGKSVMKDLMTLPEKVPSDAVDAVMACLRPVAADRPTAEQLLSDYSFFAVKDAKEML